MIGLNVAAAGASGVFGLVALNRPELVTGSAVDQAASTRFFVDMYAARAVVIAAGVVGASVLARRNPGVAALVLLAGGAVQAADLGIAVSFGTPGVAGAALGAAVHLTSAALLLRSRRMDALSG